MKIQRSRRHRELTLLLFAVLLVAAAVRQLYLADIPPALFRDEAEKALNARCLWELGTDIQGHRLPLFIEVFGVTTSAIYQYAAAPCVGLLGSTDAAARLPAALAGLGAVVFTWLFARLSYGRMVGVLAAAFLAVSPWHVLMSRWAQQGIFLPLLFSAAAFGLAAAQRGRRQGLWLSALGLGLGTYAYEPARVFAPAITIVAAVGYRGMLWRQRWIALGAAVLTLVLVSPVAWLLLTQQSAAQARFRAISIFADATFSEAMLRFVKNYAAHFTPSFLLFRGDAELRHGVGTGVLTWVQAPLSLVGIGVMLRRRRPADILVVGWILLAPVAASFTREGIPHALRTIMAPPAWAWAAAVGGARLLQPWRASAARRTAFLAAATMLAALPFFLALFGPYARRSATHWQYGVREAMIRLEELPVRGVPVTVCGVPGGGYLAAWYSRRPAAELRRQWPGSGYFREAPAPALAEAQNSAGVPAAYIAPPGLPAIGGAVIPVWYMGWGSAQGPNPTMVEIHLNRAALQQSKSSHAPQQ